MAKKGERGTVAGRGVGSSSTKLDEDGLSLRARHFAEIYDGNGLACALKAGYSQGNAKNRACELLDDERVQAIIRAREKARRDGDIATREERQKFWTAVMRDETREMEDRRKASELLGKSEGDFFERSEMSHKFPSVLPEKLDKETLIFIARGGLRAAATAAGAPSAPLEGEGDDGDDADDGAAPG